MSYIFKLSPHKMNHSCSSSSPSLTLALAMTSSLLATSAGFSLRSASLRPMEPPAGSGGGELTVEAAARRTSKGFLAVGDSPASVPLVLLLRVPPPLRGLLLKGDDATGVTSWLASTVAGGGCVGILTSLLCWLFEVPWASGRGAGLLTMLTSDVRMVTASLDVLRPCEVLVEAADVAVAVRLGADRALRRTIVMPPLVCAELNAEVAPSNTTSLLVLVLVGEATAAVVRGLLLTTVISDCILLLVAVLDGILLDNLVG